MDRLRALTQRLLAQARGASRRARVGVAALALVAGALLWGPVQAAISYLAFAAGGVSAGTTVTVARPTGATTGDMVLVVLMSLGTGNVIASAPSGWTLRGPVSGNTMTIHVYYKFLTASDGSSFAFTYSANETATATAASFRGVDPVTPIDAAQANWGAVTSSPSATGVTATVPDTMLVVTWTQSNATATYTPGSGLTEAGESRAGSGTSGISTAMAYGPQAAAGATGNKTASSTVNDDTMSAIIVLRKPTYDISGTVFEDVNYGGGAGRDRATAVAGGGNARNGARVELYSVSGTTATYVSGTTTSATGTYSFVNLDPGSYAVRVVGGTVASGRTGGGAGYPGVPTYMTDASSGSVVAVTDRVGGYNPAATSEAGWGGVGSQFNLSTGVFSAGISGQAQAIAPVTLASADIPSVDFGYNFSTIVNTNASGPGSLYQFVQNANAHGGEASLAQSGFRRTGTDTLEALPTGRETSIFMIPGGTAVPGLRAATASQLTGGVAVINVATTALSSLTSTLTNIDGSTQSANVGNTNPGLLGTGGSVGVDGVALSQVPAPEVQITGGGTGSGVVLQGNTQVARGLALYRLGNGVSLGGVSSGNTVEWNVIGTVATAFTDPGAALRTDVGVNASAQNTFTVRNNLVGFTKSGGIVLNSGSSCAISGNEVRNAGLVTSTADGINVASAAGSVTANLVIGSGGSGLDLSNASGHSVVNNTVTGSGMWAAEPNGIRLHTNAQNATIDRNVVSGSYRAGVQVESGTGLRITRNAISGNGGVAASYSGGAATTGLGIDLANNHTVEANDGARNSWQTNYFLDHPVFTSASLSGGTLTVAGYVGSAAGQATFANVTVEIFRSSVDASGYGEGATYLGSVTTSTSNGNFSGSFAVSGLAAGDRITATATDTLNNTSEFGPNFALAGSYTVSGTVFEDVNYGGGAGRALSATGTSGRTGATVELYSGSTGAWVAGTTSGAGGAYSFTGLTAGSYLVRVVGSTVGSSRLGASGAVVGVMTYRTTAASGSAVAVTDAVGGTNPAVADAAAGGATTTINTSSYVLSGATSGTAQAVAPVTLSAASITGVDFGYHFTTVVNTNDSGAGSLRQAITNANTLGNDNLLSTTGRTGGIEHLVFMVPNGTAAAGLRSSLNLFSGGVATISPTSALPAVTSTLVIDAQTQPGWTASPLIELNGSGAGAGVAGLTLNAANCIARGLVINRFTADGIAASTGSGTTVQGNWIGTDATGNSASANGRDGVRFTAAVTGATVGGTVAGQGNRIRGNGGQGVYVAPGATGVAILGNAIRDNGGQGIALGDDGVTANDTLDADTGANNLQNFPVLNWVEITSPTQITLAGSLTTAASSHYRLEFFASSAADASGYGEGHRYLGSYNMNGPVGGGVQPFNITLAAALASGEVVTATATRSVSGHTSFSDTSEFSAAVSAGGSFSGTVYEDITYTGGAGRNRSTALAAGGAGIAGATVELYSAQGTLLATTTTGAGGTYSFANVDAAHAFVRVVTATVRSTRSGTTAGLLPVQTFRREASWVGAADVTNEVGGARPATPDVAAAPALSWTACAVENGTCTFTGTRLVRYGLDTRWTTRVATGSIVCGNGVFGDPTHGTVKQCDVLDTALHSVASAAAVGAAATGVDFGYHFATVVNTSDSGQGSLRQAITNANTLGDDTALAGGVEALNFMLPNGTAAAGLRATENQFSGGVATFTPATVLPDVTAPLTIDGTRQPGWASTPVLVLDGGGSRATGLNLVGGSTGSTVRGLAIGRFTTAGVRANGAGGHVIAGNHIGTNAAGGAAAANGTGVLLIDAPSTRVGGSATADRNLVSGNTTIGVDIQGASSGTSVQGNRIGVGLGGNTRLGNGAGGVVLRSAGVTVGGVGVGNVISGNGTAGGQTGAIEILSTATGAVVQGNTLGLGADGDTPITNGWDGIRVSATGAQIGGTTAGQGNTIANFATSASGIAVFSGANNVVIEGNTIGLNAARTAARGNWFGVWFAEGTTGGRVGGTATGAANVISGNALGVTVWGATAGVAIQRNAISGNSGLGIDLSASNGGTDGVTLNDGLLITGRANQGIDFPVITAARSRGDQLTVTGYVGTGSGNAVFVGATVEVFLSDNDSSGYGEGRTYLGSFTANGAGVFTGTVTMPVSRLALGNRLTATATGATAGVGTSEFGPQFTGLLVDFVVNTNDDLVDASIGDGDCLNASGLCSLRAAIAELNAWSTLVATPTVAFAIPGCSTGAQAACRIAVGSALPTVSRAMAIDAQTQTGWSLSPIVGVDGSGAPSFASGLTIQATGSTVRGLAIGGFGVSGIVVSASDTTIEGNHVGLALGGSTALRNGSAGAANGGVWVTAGSNVRIGGTTPAQRNVLSGNGGAGLWVDGGVVTVTGNYIGTNAAGTGAVTNGRWGVHLQGGNGHRIGGSVSGEGNVISGNGGLDTGGLYITGTGQTVQGNVIGLRADGSAALPNGSGTGLFASGIDVRSGSGHLIGGTGTGEGNTIAGNLGFGVRVSATQSRILGNAIRDNLWLGIDLGADGVTANDGALSGSVNGGVDHPVLTAAGLSADGLSVVVTGAVGTGSGQAAFAGSRIEVFRAATDATGYGEGAVFLGALTADGNGAFSGTLTLSAGQLAIGDSVTATTTTPGASPVTSEFGPNLVTVAASDLLPGGFNAFDPSTPLGLLTGTISTRVAGQSSGFSVIALNLAGTGLNLGYTGSVTLTWVDARNDSGAVSGSCRASWTDLASAGSVTFSGGTGRMAVNLTPPPSATRKMRLRMTASSGLGTVTACSTDAFAVIPATLSLAATDADAATAGTTRALTNTGATGGVVHRAGRAFTVTGIARDATGALMTGYDGTPLLASTACRLPAGCTAGALGGTPASASGGSYANSSVTYAAVGVVALQLTDLTYGAVDSADTAESARTIASSSVDVGRFVPDRLDATVTAGTLATANSACMASGQASNFLGQGVGWATAPQVTLTARDANGNTLTGWTGALMKLTAGGVTPAMAVASAGSATLASSFGAVAVQDLGNGQVRLTGSGTDRFVLSLPDGSVQAATTPVLSWSAAVVDASEAAVAGNPTISSSAGPSAASFNAGGLYYSGRLSLSAAHGDARIGPRVRLQLQRWTAAGWVTMTEDRGCVTVLPANLGAAAVSGVFSASGACIAPWTQTATTRGGQAWLAMPPSPGAATGRLQLRLAGQAATGNACTAAGLAIPVTPLGLPWLTGGATGEGPTALVTWGRPNRDVVWRGEAF